MPENAVQARLREVEEFYLTISKDNAERWFKGFPSRDIGKIEAEGYYLLNYGLSRTLCMMEMMNA